MKHGSRSLLLLGVLAGILGTGGVSRPRAQSALPDKPVQVDTEEARRKIETAIAPYVEKAHKTYAEAKARFLAGLPARHTFLVTTVLIDPGGAAYEVVFVKVDKIAEGKVRGTIANELFVVKSFKGGDVHTCLESEILDWTIIRPDGSEEGNVVGNFLDTYRP